MIVQFSNKWGVFDSYRSKFEDLKRSSVGGKSLANSSISHNNEQIGGIFNLAGYVKMYA